MPGIETIRQLGKVKVDFRSWTSRKNSLELVKLSGVNNVSLVQVSSCSNTGSKSDDPYWTSRKNSLKLIELSSINKVSLVWISSCSNIGSIRDDPYWTSRKKSLKLVKQFSINKVNLVRTDEAIQHKFLKPKIFFIFF